MDNQADLARQIIKDVTINVKKTRSRQPGEKQKWVEVREILVEGGEKLFVVTASTGLKKIKEKEARFVNRHLGIKFLLNQEVGHD